MKGFAVRRWTAALLLAAALVVLVACGGAADSGLPGDPEAGQEIYETGGASGVPCLGCHTTDGSELVGPSFQGIEERAATRVEGLTAIEYMRQSIVEPDAYTVEGFDGGVMPSIYGETLSEDDINNIIAYLMTLD